MSDHELIYGWRPVSEALEEDPEGARRLLVSTRRRKGIDELLEVARRCGVEVRQETPEALDKLTDGGNHQGLVLEVRPFRYANFDRWLAGLVGPDGRATGHQLVVVLDEVQDPGNLGAIIRSAAGAGAVGVIIPQRRAAPVTPAAVRASAGLARRLPVAQVVNLARTLGQLRDAGFWVTGAATRQGVAPWQVDLTGPVVIVVGSEGKGMRHGIERACDHLVTIPLAPGVESLNVSAAAAMLLYEVGRQQAGGTGGGSAGGDGD